MRGVNIEGLKEHIGKRDGTFNTNALQDAYEFLSYVINQLHEDALNQAIVPTVSSGVPVKL